jgi:hypothetical protein
MSWWSPNRLASVLCRREHWAIDVLDGTGDGDGDGDGGVVVLPATAKLAPFVIARLFQPRFVGRSAAAAKIRRRPNRVATKSLEPLEVASDGQSTHKKSKHELNRFQ